MQEQRQGSLAPTVLRDSLVGLEFPTELSLMTRQLNRRKFVQTTAFAAAAVPFLRLSAKESPSERVRIGFIACGGRARQLMNIMRHFPDVEILAISDVIESRMDQAMEVLSKDPYPHKPDRLVDYREMLDRKDIDAVVIATTQHWHGLPHIHASQAGKHVFVEKPLSHTIEEGRAMVQSTRRHGIIAMMGTQQRAGPHYQKAVELIQSGRLGKVALVECWNYHNTGNRVGRPPNSEPPAGCHWDRWLGPAPEVPFNRARLDHSWWFDYAGGMLTNWAIHHIDVILWAMGYADPQSVSCTGGKYVVDDLADSPDTIDAAWEFPGWLMQYRYRGFNNFHTVQSRPHHHGICFHGNKATLVLDRYGYELRNDDKPGEIAEQMSANPYFSERDPDRSEQDGPWQRTFIDCIKQLKQPPVSLEQSHQGTVCCHLANISHFTGRTVAWDGEQEKILNDPEAAGYLTRPRRKGYELPA